MQRIQIRIRPESPYQQQLFFTPPHTPGKRPGNGLQKQPFKESLWTWTDSVPLPHAVLIEHSTRPTSEKCKKHLVQFVVTLFLTLLSDFINGFEIFITSGISCRIQICFYCSYHIRNLLILAPTPLFYTQKLSSCCRIPTYRKGTTSQV